jgi:hypothetical protein
MKTLLLATAAALLLPVAAASARARTARCDIATEEAPYRGPCRFAAEGGGSFSLTPIGRRGFMGDVTTISVAVVGRGEAEISGLTTSGVNSRWGHARRSRRDRACWVGRDFTVCVD